MIIKGRYFTQGKGRGFYGKQANLMENNEGNSLFPHMRDNAVFFELNNIYLHGY